MSAGQCWHWFGRPRAGAEARRLLVAGGALVICHMDYLPLADNVCAATEELILEHNPAWTMAGGTGIHADWTLDVATAGFTGIETFSFDVEVPYSHEARRGRMRTCNGIGATPPPTAVSDLGEDPRDNRGALPTRPRQLAPGFALHRVRADRLRRRRSWR